MEVYYFDTDQAGNETGEPVAVSLDASGVADVSRLPSMIQGALKTFGVMDERRSHLVFPKDGEAFLRGLLSMSSQAMRFRSSPERLPPMPS